MVLGASPSTIADEELEELKQEFQKRLGAADRSVAALQVSRFLDSGVTLTFDGGRTQFGVPDVVLLCSRL
jgi:hypothetical protein